MFLAAKPTLEVLLLFAAVLVRKPVALVSALQLNRCGTADPPFSSSAASPVADPFRLHKLQLMGKKIVHCGDAGAGQIAKVNVGVALGFAVLAPMCSSESDRLVSLVVLVFARLRIAAVPQLPFPATPVLALALPHRWRTTSFSAFRWYAPALP